MSKLTIKQIKQKCVKTHGSKFKYDFSNFKDTNSKIVITCPVHGDFEQNIRSHYNGTGCKRCSKPGYIWTLQEFLLKAKEVHTDLYDYNKVTHYKNTEAKVPIVCRQHGLFWQAPHEHLSGKGCSVCAGNKPMATNEFIQKASIKHNGLYSYPRIEKFSQLPEKLTITCEQHGDFQQNPSHHLSGSGCQICGNIESHKRYLNKPTTLYYIKVNNYYKIGITTRTVNKRFDMDTAKVNIEVIKTWDFSTGKIAYLVEQYLLHKTKQYEIPGCTILHKGNTEIRSKDVLEEIETSINSIFN